MESRAAPGPALRIVFFLACGSVVLWGMSQYADFINAVVLAVLIALGTDPLVNRIRRSGRSRWAALVAALLVVYVALALLALLFIYAGAEFIREVPAYQQQSQALADQVEAALQGAGLSGAGVEALANKVNLSRMLDRLAEVVASLGKVVNNGITLILLTTFLFVDVVLWPGRLQELARRGHGYARRLAEFTVDLRQYIVVMVVVGSCIGALNTVMFYLFDVPYALLWGVLSGILNFIPFIGFWLGLIPPATLTLLEYGPERALALTILYIAINGFVQNVVQPRLVVTRLNLTPFSNLVSVTFWPLVLGPVGAIIGVPLTMAVRSLLLDADPVTRWLAELTSSKLPPETPAPDETPALSDAPGT